MGEISNIQWFPGHMTKTKRLIQANINMVDAVAEIVDARIPESSRNPVIKQLIGSKPKILILNKADYADDKATLKWKQYYAEQGYKVIICDCKSGKGVKSFIPAVKDVLSEILAKRKAKGMIGKSLRVMVVGIPNVGKSSFINRISGSNKAKAEDRPGVTRGTQWITLDKDLELLDTPGILWPKFEDQSVAIKLAYTGAIKDDVTETFELAENLLEFLKNNYFDSLSARYKITADEVTVETIGRKRGMLISGGEIDTERAAIMILDEFRSGKLGKITLEYPE